ncbi:class I SAM-dependent methyltransferase [Paractinoplanes hotanensis]|uniref:Class I SAM-dependent methyltransferase n=1 Tax=Paractinoplanes hotanensis TaxID=2906497 RepID=A0ABT0Y551_9ACTN|nr:class I SAM-dependent methyltransferase [Actinoplanes hotanensis]MCM4081159.1 class I SAM-dependent methyltransferase [Actinoplanes hotanensis]
MPAQRQPSLVRRATMVVNRRAGALKRTVQQAHRRGGWSTALTEGAYLFGELAARPARRWREQRLERRWNLDTRADTSVPHPDPGAAAFDDAVRYSPIPIHHFERLLRRLPLDDPRDYAYVDLGCGKGRTLALAAQHRFLEVTGVEFDTRLGDIARANAYAYAAAVPDAPAITVHTIDAVDFQFPGTPSVIFLFNPFGADTLKAVANNLMKSLDDEPRRVILAYFNPVHADVLEACPVLRRTASARHWTIYESAT